jgi:hypothetical protein
VGGYGTDPGRNKLPRHVRRVAAVEERNDIYTEPRTRTSLGSLRPRTAEVLAEESAPVRRPDRSAASTRVVRTRTSTCRGAVEAFEQP